MGNVTDVAYTLVAFFSEEEISALVLKDIPNDCYILEVDIHYPTSLHSQHDDHALAPEPLVIDCSPHNSLCFQSLHHKQNLLPICMINSSM